MNASIKVIQSIVKGALVQGDDSVIVRGISIDSRSMKKGDLFIAIQGVRFDGHRFISRVMKKGASAIIVSKNQRCQGDIPIIRVKDTTKALGQIAAWHRAAFDIPVIAVTGSAGKTTTKDMITAVLESRYKVLKNVKTENNQYGVPLTLFKLDSSYQMVVLELGTNHPGEIALLSKIAKPTVAVFTNIGESHLKGLKSVDGVFREKRQLIKNMDPKGCVIINKEDPYLCKLSPDITYGINVDSDYQANAVKVLGNTRVQFESRKITFTLKSPTRHNISNALAAICCGCLYKIEYNVMSRRLARFAFCDKRQVIKRIGSIWCIDDTYNANPVSFRSAIATLDELLTRGQKIVVCADMKELGTMSEKLHRALGEMIAQTSINVVLSIGSQARHVTQEIIKHTHQVKVFHYSRLSDLHRRLKIICQPSDIVLVKGSRSMRMERTVDFLKKGYKN